MLVISSNFSNTKFLIFIPYPLEGGTWKAVLIKFVSKFIASSLEETNEIFDFILFASR